MAHLTKAQAFAQLDSASPRASITLGRVYARLYPIRERTVKQLADQFNCSQTVIRLRLDELERQGLVQWVLKKGKSSRPVRCYTINLRRTK